MDTGNKDDCHWPNLLQFKDPPRSIPWSKLPSDTVYKINKMHLKNESPLLELENSVGDLFFVWPSHSVLFALNLQKETRFIYYIGLKAAEKKDTFYYDFKLY